LSSNWRVDVALAGVEAAKPVESNVGNVRGGPVDVAVDVDDVLGV
jgi:hypothetical protein